MLAWLTLLCTNDYYSEITRGQFLKKSLSPLVVLSMEKTMVTMVISELKSISRLKIFRETEPW